ncbi:MAG: type II toxin-antitoxin system Phd/YefM family antitoxin [Spirochaeta sp.]|jgi:prevent-host-death family protein|nr:type II toxin-antitoxin system Phd/YefM family antitoxin [Spirochaeta sp.]
MNTWNATDAKHKFPQLLREAGTEPQLVLLRGRPLGVIIGYEQFIKIEEQHTTRTVSEWVDELAAIKETEDDPVLYGRKDRRDQFGEDWE